MKKDGEAVNMKSITKLKVIEKKLKQNDKKELAFMKKISLQYNKVVNQVTILKKRHVLLLQKMKVKKLYLKLTQKNTQLNIKLKH